MSPPQRGSPDLPEPGPSLPQSLILALAIAAMAQLVLVVTWPESVFGLTYDDAFYYFEIGRRMAQGQGSTFDGLHATNGYHPLWMAVVALTYLPGWTGDLPVRLLLIAQIGLIALGSGLALRSLPWVHADRAGNLAAGAAALGWLLVPALLRTQLNGLESAMVVLTQGAAIALWLRIDGPLHAAPARLRWGLGAALIAAFLARTDAALLLPLVLVFALPDLRRTPRAAMALLPTLGPPTAVILLSFALNQALFDTPMQVSGSLKRVAPGLSGAVILAGAGGWIALILLAGRRGLPRGLPRVALVVRRMGPHLAFLGALAGYYLGLQTFPRLWYFAPASLAGLVLVVALVLDLAELARRERPTAPEARAVAPVVLLVLAPLGLAIPLTGLPLFTDEALAIRRTHLAMAAWLDRELPAGTRVGSWDAGLVGYASAQPIINLDGVVNDVHWLRALQAGTAGERLRAEGITWYANHSLYEGGRCTSLIQALADLDPQAADRAVLVQTWPFTQRASLNGQALATHQMAGCILYTGPGSPPFGR